MAKRRRQTEVTVIPITHWDRAWYWPIERFRIKLIDLYQRLKALWKSEPRYRFAIDGQSVAVDDFVEVFPEDQPLLAAMGRAGRFTAGPLYVQPDLYCTGGEAFIRNLQIGTATAEKFHALQRVVYLPDTFGITPEIPMLVAGFGYRTFVFMRGIAGRPGFARRRRFFKWRCPDGSVIRVFLLCDGYSNAGSLGLQADKDAPPGRTNSGINPTFNINKAIDKLEKAARKQIDGAGEPYVLLAGGDHQLPRAELPEVLSRASKSDLKYVFSDWNKAEDAIWRKDARSWLEYQGEFHGRGAADSLGGTIDCRPYLKQNNARAEWLLGAVAERADASVMLLSGADPAGRVLLTAWKQLLRVQPHDDICGCSVDAVHRENELLTMKVEQAGDAVRRRMASRMIQHFGGLPANDNRYAFFLYSTLGQPGRQRVRMRLDFEGSINYGDSKPPEKFAIVDESGREIDFRELGRVALSHEHPHPAVDVELDVDLPPYTFKRYFLEERRRVEIADGGARLENERLAVTIRPNGSVDILDKKTGKKVSGAGLFSDQSDIGDEYIFKPVEGDREKVLANTSMRRTSSGGRGISAVEVRGDLRLPASSNTKGRSKKTVAVPVKVDYSLGRFDNWLTVRIRIVNTATDHRLRWNINLPACPRESTAGIKFNLVRRPCLTKKKNGNVEPVHPLDLFVAAETPRGGVAVFAKYPMNYEVVTEKKYSGPRLAISLFRAVGELGSGMITRTPEAQMLREHEITLAVRPFGRDERRSLPAEAFRWRGGAVTGLVMGFESEKKPVSAGPLIEISPGPVEISAFKRSFDGRRVILRLFNAGDKACRCRFRVAGATGLKPVGLNEKDLPAAIIKPGRDGWFDAPVCAFGLASFAVT